MNGSRSSPVMSPSSVLVGTTNESMCGGTMVSTKMNSLLSEGLVSWCGVQLCTMPDRLWSSLQALWQPNVMLMRLCNQCPYLFRSHTVLRYFTITCLEHTDTMPWAATSPRLVPDWKKCWMLFWTCYQHSTPTAKSAGTVRIYKLPVHRSSTAIPHFLLGAAILLIMEFIITYNVLIYNYMSVKCQLSNHPTLKKPRS